jgi:hypothetical protein
MSISDEQVLKEASRTKAAINKSIYKSKINESRKSVLSWLFLLGAFMVTATYITFRVADWVAETPVDYILAGICLLIPALILLVGLRTFVSSALKHIELVIELNSDRKSK